MSGGRDPGLYLINAIHIAETGSFQYASDPYMVQHYAALSGVARLDYPALYSAYEYGLTNDVGQVVPQFLPVLPAMLAVGYDLGGIGAAVRVNGVTGLLCLAAAYALVKPLYGGKAATLFTAFLLVNPAQLWGRGSPRPSCFASCFCLRRSGCFGKAGGPNGRLTPGWRAFYLATAPLCGSTPTCWGRAFWCLCCTNWPAGAACRVSGADGNGLRSVHGRVAGIWVGVLLSVFL